MPISAYGEKGNQCGELGQRAGRALQIIELLVDLTGSIPVEIVWCDKVCHCKTDRNVEGTYMMPPSDGQKDGIAWVEYGLIRPNT